MYRTGSMQAPFHFTKTAEQEIIYSIADKNIFLD